jgi:hypothetical protein
MLFVSESVDLEPQIKILQQHLLGPNAHLVIVDMRVSDANLPLQKGVTYLHAPPPPSYAWTRLTACLGSEVQAYEEKIMTLITTLVKS